jgi:hypothetical protein
MANKWLAHVKETSKRNPGLAFKDVLKMAKKTYKKSAVDTASKKSRKNRKSLKNRKSNKSRSHNKVKRGGAASLADTAAEFP